MSLQIRIDGQVVELNVTATTTLELINPYLVYTDILSSKAVIPEIPATSRNRRIMGFPDLLQTDAIGQRYTCQKYYNGQLLQEGVAILAEATEQNFALAVIKPLGEVFGDLHTESLSEINFGALAVAATLQPVLQAFGRNVVAFPTILNPDYYGSNGGAAGYSGRVNEYTTSSGSYTATGPKVPMVFLGELLRRIGELTGVSFYGEFLADADLANLLLYNTRALDSATTVELRYYLPEMTIPELLLELRKLFNLAIDINTVDRSIGLNFVESIHKKAARKDWSGKAGRAYKKRPETARRLQLSSDIDGGDGLAKDKPAALADYLTPALSADTGISKLPCRFSTLLIDPATGLATTKQQGITALYGQTGGQQSGGQISPRLLFWNGLQNGTPTATANRGGRSLYWTGASGLAAQFWPLTEQARASQFYQERAMELDEVDLATLDWSEKVHINGLDYLVATILVDLPITKPATTLLVRV